jgi:hypothetical protein
MTSKIGGAVAGVSILATPHGVSFSAMARTRRHRSMAASAARIYTSTVDVVPYRRG